MRGWLARLFGVKSEHAAQGEVRDPALSLARDWVLAQGGRVSTSSTDVLQGALPDGTPVRYTIVPLRLRQQPELTLLMQNSPEFDLLRQDIADRAGSLALRVTQPAASAVALGRTAFAPPREGCQICASGGYLGDESNLCADCPLRKGRLVLIGAGGVREVTVESEREQTAHEYVYRMSIASSHGRREELIRIAVDAATGARREPLAEATIQRAVSAPASNMARDTQEHVAHAEAILRPAVQAAARLSRAQALLAFQQQQEDVAATYERLVIEATESRPKVLKAWERALDRVADAYAVEAVTELVATAAISTPTIQARVRLRDGASLQATIDPSRGIVVPWCANCERMWRVGVRCAEGHITCLDCQRQCAHCGRRRCTLCAALPLDACAVCGRLTCTACARATSRKHHHNPIPLVPGSEHFQGLTTPGAGAPAAGSASDIGAPEDVSDDLCIGDLDAMTPATWRTFVMWLLGEMGYRIERERHHALTHLAFECRVLNAQDQTDDVRTNDDRAAASSTSGPLVMVIGHRPVWDADASLTQAHVIRLGLSVDPPMARRALLITTARYASGVSDRLEAPASAPITDVVDRSQLAQWLSDRPMAYRRTREAAAAATDDRAAAASRVRAIIMDDLTRLAEQLAPPAVDRRAQEALKQSPLMEELTSHLAIARQSLSALETLIEQWEGMFMSQPTRFGTQEFAAAADEFFELTSRAEHLLTVLRDASDVIVTATAASKLSDWLMAVRDELAETCRALIVRCQSLDPTAWRSFDAVYDLALAQASVEHLSAAQRASTRARKLRDELDARDPASQVR